MNTMPNAVEKASEVLELQVSDVSTGRHISRIWHSEIDATHYALS